MNEPSELANVQNPIGLLQRSVAVEVPSNVLARV